MRLSDYWMLAHILANGTGLTYDEALPHVLYKKCEECGSAFGKPTYTPGRMIWQCGECPNAIIQTIHEKVQK